MEEEPDTHPAEAAFILAKLARSDFRRRFRLGPSERSYFRTKGAHVIRRHAADFIAGRLAPAVPPKDGRQTPMRGHPVFVAQHATATCCRGCLEKWHGIPRGRALRPGEQAWIADLLMLWIARQMERPD